MKKLIIVLILMALATAAFSQELDKLNQGLQKIADEFAASEKVPEGSTVAVISTFCRDPRLADFIINTLAERIAEKGFNVIPPEKVKAFMDSVSLSQYDESFYRYAWLHGNTEKSVQTGRELGADFVLNGRLNMDTTFFGDSRSRFSALYVNAINTEDGELLGDYICHRAGITKWGYNRKNLLAELGINPNQTTATTQAADPSEEKDPTFTISAAFSWYFNEEPSESEKAFGIYPYYMDTAYDYNLQLGMGLKLFQNLSAMVDFKINNTEANHVLNLAGKIGSKWFSVVLDYYNAGGDFYWSDDYRNGTFVTKGTYITDDNGDLIPNNRPYAAPKTKIPDTWEINILTLGLMSPYWIWPGTDLAFNIGFVYKSVNSFIAYERDDLGEEIRYLYLETDTQLNLFGFRISGDAYEFLEEDLGFAFNKFKLNLILKADIDVCFGKVEPRKETLEFIKEDGGKTESLQIIDISFRLMAGIDMKMNLTEKKRLSIGAGVDLNASMPLNFDMGVGVARPWVYTQHLSIGPFVRVKAKI